MIKCLIRLSGMIPGLILGSTLVSFSSVSHDFPATVRNKAEPRPGVNAPKIMSEPSLVLDLESPEVAGTGIGIAGEFDVDNDGNIYIVAFRNTENFIYKFDAHGRFLRSFGKDGQGPGELQWPMGPTIVGGDRLSIWDAAPKRLLTYDQSGRFIGSMHAPHSFKVKTLPNGNFLVRAFTEVSPADYEHGIFLHDSHFDRVKELDRCRFSQESGDLPTNFMWRVTPSFIYLFNALRGYDIRVFDHDGNPVRRILKDYRPVQATAELRKLFLGEESSNPATASFFPRPLPPVNQIFADDEDRLYALTYEPGLAPGEYRIDVFDDKGSLIAKWSLSLLWGGMYQGPQYIVIKKRSIYFYREKDSGFKVLYRYPLTYR